MVPRARPAPRASCERLDPRLLLVAPPPVIDLLAVYTPAAAAQVGSDARILARIQGAVDSMNQALVNSNISLTVRLVRAEPIAYASSGDVFTDRVRLETPGDGFMDNIFALRNQYGADLVALISDGFGGGNANLLADINSPNNANLAFSASFVSAVGPGNLTLAHELGHTLGGGHERGNPTQPAVGPFPYSVGYRFPVATPDVTASYTDVMSYGYGNDIPLIQYANPAVSHRGIPTGKPAGDPNSADIASTFLATALIVAGYRARVVQDTTGPTARLFETRRTGDLLTFTVRYTDDSAPDHDSFDSADILVSGPGGFALPATFVSVDRPAVTGAYKFATYRVLLPATSPPTTSLTFTLQPNAVKDVHNNAAPAGPIPQHTAYYAGSPVESSFQFAAYTWSQPLSAPLTAGSTFTTYGSLTPDNTAHFYSFTLAQPATVAATLTGLSANADLLIARDTNHNDLFDHKDNDPNPANNNVEILTTSGFNAGTTDEGAALTLAAGTYYVYTYLPFPDDTAATNYTLTLRPVAPDTTAPTAVADTKDVKAAGTPTLDFAVTFTDDFFLSGASVRYDTAIDIHVMLDSGFEFDFFPLFPAPELNSPSFADAPTRTVYYRLTAAPGGFTAADNGTYTLSIHDPGPGNPRPRDAAGNPAPAGVPIGSYRISIGTPDTAAPTAALTSAQPPTPGATTWSFTVAYKDNVALDTTTIGNADLRVTGPGGYNQPATLSSVTATTTIGTTQLATYTVPAPGGYWDSTDNGPYTIALQSNQIRDAAGNFAVATSFPAVAASSPNLTAIPGSPASVSLVGTAAPNTLRIGADATFIYLTLDDSLLYFVPRAAAPRFSASGLGGNDAIFFEFGTLTGTLSPGPGTNSLAVTGGALTLTADAGAGSAPLAVTVSSTATLTLASTQHFTSLSLTDSARVTLPAASGAVLVTGTLSLAGSSVLDLADNAAIIDYTGPSPAPTVRTLLHSAYAAGTWAGTPGAPGITSSSAASTPNRAIGYAEASALGLSIFASQQLDPTALLLKYTHTGDANLSGTINPDDFALADRGRLMSGSTWLHGDFNYDAQVTPADLTLLNRTLAAITAATPPPVPASTTTAPPRPTPARRPALSATPLRYPTNWSPDRRVVPSVLTTPSLTPLHDRRLRKLTFLAPQPAEFDL